MTHLINLTGKSFGRLVVVSRGPNEKFNMARWNCRCSCGKVVLVRGNHLRTGRTVSCGCYRNEWPSINKTTHGAKPRSGPSKAYMSWVGMKARCFNPNNSRWKYYGGRGITVCDRWLSFENFLADMGERPKGLTLERLDNNAGYSPTNCVWASYFVQRHNRRR